MLRLIVLAALAAGPALAQDLSLYRSAEAATQVPLDAQTRALSTDALQATLYEVVSLSHADHQAHWNVVGQNFYSLHDMLGEFYKALDPYIDMLGARLVILGEPADIAPGRVAQGDGLDPMPEGYLNDYDVPPLLSERYYEVTTRLQDRILETGEAGDLETQDLFIGLGRTLERHLWMLRALQRGGDGVTVR